ncbi:MAG: hypothetical protein K940chlam1_00795 [Candidatus Anoxychlamydiales bacterium]|nr:hypothetical protein [Candidatus Anoxychlamydiales bacterium]NGX36778.1 hypothetical protein [Candidatus Anoxychlamydiales bacterium]
MPRSVTMSSADENTIIAAKVLSASAIGFLACRYIKIIDPRTGALFSALAMVIDALATKFIKASKMNTSLISAGISFMFAMSLTNYFAKFTVIQAIKVTFYTAMTQLALSTLGAGILMGSFAALAAIGANKLIEKF